MYMHSIGTMLPIIPMSLNRHVRQSIQINVATKSVVTVELLHVVIFGMLTLLIRQVATLLK